MPSFLLRNDSELSPLPTLHFLNSLQHGHCSLQHLTQLLSSPETLEYSLFWKLFPQPTALTSPQAFLSPVCFLPFLFVLGLCSHSQAHHSLSDSTVTSKLMSPCFCGGSTMQILALWSHAVRDKTCRIKHVPVMCLPDSMRSVSISQFLLGKNVECPHDFRVWPKKPICIDPHWTLRLRAELLCPGPRALPGAWVVSTVAIKLFSRISIF